MSQELFIQMMSVGYKTTGLIECVEGLPEGAECVGTVIEPKSLDAFYIFQHPSFDPISLGDIIPELKVSWRWLHYAPMRGPEA